MKNIFKIVILVLVIVLFSACGEDRAGFIDNNSSTIIINGIPYNQDNSKDTDGDGLSDIFEIEHDLNISNSDSDGDGISDLIEMQRDDLNATNPDTDGDGLNDGDEINKYHTRPDSADSDGDCLLDSFEILNYDTNATNSDSDGDGVEDGIEIYSYNSEINSSCINNPETLKGGYNHQPAVDGIPNRDNDIINALDPNNDSDGDGQVNIKELNCSEGNPKDIKSICPFILDTKEGKILTEHGYAYVPGGFDVDGDGINEKGFWISRFQARKSGIEIPAEEVIANVGNINKFVSKNFKVLNRNVEITNYKESELSSSSTKGGNELIFNETDIAGLKRISDFTPYLALVCLKRYKLQDENGIDLDINITMPTLKQYVQVKMLLDEDKKNQGDGRHIRNGLLGIDENLPIKGYNLIIDEFGETHKEYLRNLVQLRDIDTSKEIFTVSDVPSWWRINSSKFKSSEKAGSHSTEDLGYGIGPDKDAYGVIVRGGNILDVSEGMAGILTDDDKNTNGISFRAATPYFQ
ncbi:MAG TPA: hypothetical protein ENK88_04875 [Campylobacterales bacterium]|nr:hypothetical protein [Campylobacterales bacterium]